MAWWQVVTKHLGPVCSGHWSRGVIVLQQRRVRRELYVDDHILAAGGSLADGSRTLASLADRVVWIGAQLSVEDFGI